MKGDPRDKRFTNDRWIEINNFFFIIFLERERREFSEGIF